MKIAILTLGTRGDVQPYAVLGQALQQRGHQVTLATAKNFESLVRSYGIGFAPVEADYQAILQTEEGKRIMKGNPLAIRRNLEKWIYPLIRDSLSDFHALAQDSDRVLYHVKTLADSFADQFPEKMIRAMVVPAVQPTSAFANPAFSGLPIPSFLNRFSYKLTDWGMAMMKKPIGQFRESLGLPKAYAVPSGTFLYGISEHFLAKPNDYPANAHFSGFWFGTSETALDAALLAFLEAGAPPLVITFGSMPFKSSFDLQDAILKLTQTGQTRVLVIKGWGLETTDKLALNPNVKVIASAPYEKLFPLCRAIVHHGGVGTTAECMRAGKPFMVCPILHPIGDQLFWGKLAHQKGIAVPPVPISKLSEESFLKSIQTLLNNESLTQASRAMQQLLLQENGIDNAIALVEAQQGNGLR